MHVYIFIEALGIQGTKTPEFCFEKTSFKIFVQRQKQKKKRKKNMQYF